MRERRNYRRDKKGTSTIFIAIIMAALIFVEGIYLAAIIDINRRITIERALRLQIETILSNYNEEMFLEYGIYGFSDEDISHEVFINTIEATGYTYGEDIFVEGYRTLNTVQLEKAIATYYSYRSIGILVGNFKDSFSFVFDKLDDFEFFDKLRRFSASGGGKALRALFKGSNFINGLLESDELKEITELTTGEDSMLSELFTNIREANSADLDFDDDFDPTEYFQYDFINDARDFFSDSSRIVEDDLFRLCLSHYVVYNFESCVKEFDGEPDSNIRGTLFTDLNADRCNDMEYLLQGNGGAFGIYSLGHLISFVVMMSEVVNLLMNEKFMKVCSQVAKVLSIVLEVALEGVKIPPWVIEMIIIMYAAIVVMIKDMVLLYKGDKVTVFKFSKAPEPLSNGIDMDYKDFAFLIGIMRPNEVKLTRLCDLMTEKYGEIYTKIELGTVYNDQEILAECGYELYGF